MIYELGLFIYRSDDFGLYQMLSKYSSFYQMINESYSTL